MSDARKLDQFYTVPKVAKECFEYLKSKLPEDVPWRFLEPSAGTGAFYQLLPARRRLGVDLDPKFKGVKKRDFLKEFSVKSGRASPHKWVVVGNPPFGKNASLAVDFFNKAATFAEFIAFIVPLTFRKTSLQKRLARNFELIGERVLELDSFEFEGEPYAVPCCFQIWKRSDKPRVHIDTPLTHKDFEFCKDPEDADFAFRRVGGLAGKVIRDIGNYSPASHYFVRSNIGKRKLIQRLEKIDWGTVKGNTAGNPSISKREMVAAYSAIVDAEPAEVGSAHNPPWKR